jgi:GDPmannose 4,6-dehydratase
MSKRTALITGITGQDGSYLAELLLERGYDVHGLVRRSSSEGQSWRIAAVRDRLALHEGDLLDVGSLVRVVSEVQPDEVYNLAAQSHVGTSFHSEVFTGDVGGLGAARLLEAARQVGKRGVRFYQASTSEMFGKNLPPQNEATAFWPRSPYGAAKLYAHWMTVNAREAHGMHASSGILFNHESPRRGENFVTRKVTLGAARIKAGASREKVRLGNLEAERDWGHAREYVEGMWRMLQQEEPGDYVLGTGVTHTVRELCQVAFGAVGLDWEEWIEVDPKFYRPSEVAALRADARKAARVLGWVPTVSFEAMIGEMVREDLARLRRGGA